MAASDAEKHVWENEDGDLVVVLDLPGGPREYVVADVSAATGRWVTRLTDKAMAAQRRLDAGEDGDDIDADLHLSEEAEKDLYEEVLGSTLDDMEADGVRWRKVRFTGQVAYAWVLRGLEGARNVWEAGGEAPKPNRQERRTTSRASGSKTRAGGASASSTKPRASTSRTKTRS